MIDRSITYYSRFSGFFNQDKERRNGKGKIIGHRETGGGFQSGGGQSAEWRPDPDPGQRRDPAADPRRGETAPLPEFLVPSHHAIMGYEGTPKILDPMTKEVKILEPLH